ncbi:NAD(P)H-dependent oxidoreductase [Enhydrobacter sp.]|uniref:NAD(P)H-dependent oxidoreductase n=1 Tax=Enhydrobacter sp. TaxID=1894999 RepID=UPI00262DBFD1|nr:NAD(P)H-dependent oxidoreductase [Enhydrobacter sp.]WIM12412.1 MAG: Multimeric flavodoxin WrbA [Enhydrobacter sp.]
MSKVAIVYHSGYGHTKALAEAVAAGAAEAAGTEVSLVPVIEAEARAAELDAADAIIFGSPTYMGGVSAEFAKFKDWTSKRWASRAWQDKLAAGFTGSAAWNGDKHNTLYQFITLAAQHGMVWVGLGLPPGNNHSKGSGEDLNRTGASVGAMAQANADQGVEGIGASDFRTMSALGRRVAQAAQRWHAAPLAHAA